MNNNNEEKKHDNIGINSNNNKVENIDNIKNFTTTSQHAQEKDNDYISKYKQNKNMKENENKIRKYNSRIITIPSRINEIKKIMNKNLCSFVDFDRCDTENFVPNNNSEAKGDIRKVLGKKKI